MLNRRDFLIGCGGIFAASMLGGCRSPFGGPAKSKYAVQLYSITTPHALCKTEAEYGRFGCEMSAAAETAKSYGIKVGIHTTYDHFRVKFGGVTAWETIFRDASPLLQQQIDTGNVFHVVGRGLIPLLRKYRGRHYSVHLKENEPTPTATLGERPTDGGESVPWTEVLACLADDDVAWRVIEAEAIPDSLKPLSDSLRFITNLESARFLNEKGEP